MILSIFFFFKQKTAYEMRISDWSSDVCSSDLGHRPLYGALPWARRRAQLPVDDGERSRSRRREHLPGRGARQSRYLLCRRRPAADDGGHLSALRRQARSRRRRGRSEEHTSELQSLMRNSYAVFCLKKKKNNYTT